MTKNVEVTPQTHCNMELRSAVFNVLRRHEVSEQCFAEVAMVTHAALPLQQSDSYIDALTIGHGLVDKRQVRSIIRAALSPSASGEASDA